MPAGKPKSSTHLAGHTTYVFDAAGNRTVVIDSDGNRTNLHIRLRLTRDAAHRPFNKNATFCL